MSEAVETLEGWWVLHDFRRVDWPRWHAASAAERAALVGSWQGLCRELAAGPLEQAGDSAVYAVVGHKADLLFLHFRPRLDDLLDAQMAVNLDPARPFLVPATSYLSVIELSGYLAKPGTGPLPPEVQRRLHPAIPPHRYVCFYPMNKRRQGADNWYMLSREERARLMAGHGQIGRRYAGQVVQIITGSQGLDDWEWGVTLFADDPLVFKKLVYEMRFDETSARYAEFGSFVVGTRLEPAEWPRWLNTAAKDG